MKEHRINYFKRIHSLRQRLIIFVIFGIGVWCIIIMAVLEYSFRMAEKNRIQTIMQGDIEQLTDEIDENYLSLIKISQQMTMTGAVGKTFSLYLEAQEPYDKIKYANDLSVSMNTMLFNYKAGALAGYFYSKKNNFTTVISSLPIRDTDNPLQFTTLMMTHELALQAPHTCMNTFSGKDTLSILRKVLFDNREYYIYTEMYTDIVDRIKSISKFRGVKYSYLQLDTKGNICYSNNPDFLKGHPFLHKAEQKNTGTVKGYRYISVGSNYGFVNVLLLPQSAYLRQEYHWQLNVFIVFLIGIIFIIIILLLFLRFIYEPIRLLGKGMEKVGKGNLEPIEYTFHMDEFDELFAQFNNMKNEVGKLMEKVRLGEYEKQQLEIDKLYYQINPHFLMNALNSLHWMAISNHQKEIDEYVYQLNFILGYSLGKIHKKATFRTELKSLELYLELQKKRYDFHVWKEIQIEPYLDYPCARLILQPLAENAICHNMDDLGNLWVSVRCDGEKVIIVIRDDGQGVRWEKKDTERSLSVSRLNKGIGLRYVQLSLQSFYGEEASIKIESVVNQGTSVIVEVPLKKEEDGCTKY